MDCVCCICRNSLNHEISRTGCGHLFHSSCLASWVRIEHPSCHCCPLCRASMGDAFENELLEHTDIRSMVVKLRHDLICLLDKDRLRIDKLEQTLSFDPNTIPPSPIHSTAFPEGVVTRSVSRAGATSSQSLSIATSDIRRRSQRSLLSARWGAFVRHTANFHPGVHSSEIRRLAGVAWQQMTEDERRVFQL